MILPKTKGFIGPLGDDLPSLIPLVFALIMFFYSFTFAWNVFDERNTVFSDNLAVLELGSVLKGNSYISGHDEFLANCSKAKSVKRIRFVAGLLPLSNNPLASSNARHFKGLSPENASNASFTGIEADAPNLFYVLQENGKEFACTNAEGEVIPKVYNVRVFPVALQRDYCIDISNAFRDADACDLGLYTIKTTRFFVKPMLLVVISWD